MPLFATSFLALWLVTQNPAGTTQLDRKYPVGKRMTYSQRSNLTTEVRGKGLQTWMPSDIGLSYDFTVDFEKSKGDGIVVARYIRPTITQSEDDGRGIKKRVEKINYDLRLTLSPINEILDTLDLSKPDPKKKKGGEARLTKKLTGAEVAQAPIFGEFVSEIYRLALFVGTLDSSLDFAPRLPLDAVKIGDTWQRTVGYQPQKLKGKAGKSAVQRLDYTFVFQGPKTVNGKPVLRIQAKLDFKTDLLDFLKSILEEEGVTADTGIEGFPLFFKSTIDFDLDPVTHNTIRAIATTEGGYRLTIEDIKDEAIQEERFKGRSTLSLLSTTPIPAPVKK